jgi:putative transposase
MPWKECKPMDERLRFIARLLEGEKMAPVCREFGISRVTGYKIFDRYKACGLDGLYDRSKAPYRQANKLPFQVERAILGIKKEFPSWGAPKIRDKLIREYPMIPPPAVSTIHAALDRNGLVKRRKRRRYKACGTPLSAAHAQRPLVRRLQGRVPARQPAVLLPAHHHGLPLPLPARLRRPRVDQVEVRLLRLRAHLPRLRPAGRDPHRQRHALRRARGRCSAVSPAVWWLRLGIRLQRIKPGKPQQNGRHERMHLTLKNETTKPAAFNFLQQQERFEDFIRVYNQERPHQALGGVYPAEIYTPSARPTSRPRIPITRSTIAPSA